ncbi:hypothetical protein BUALT_Bualt13G0010300 [Buddleja alternifolia]|uniref:BSD domain-containing protein n=1 Tax=Buddleja alternifolia TaxID=168488 RepID=A0AAV6WSY3_9LAMI|nr:hypothetical protein BUALT_Bualt13G0010300 [Buddleja alternifolia]
MNFFKSILLDDEDPPKSENPHESDPNSSLNSPREDRDSNDVAEDVNGGGWSFGGLIKTLASQSESVIETYRRDLKEFGSGLQKETVVIREVASRAVKDLPASIEAGTSAAQGVLDGVLKSTAEIIAKEAQVFDGETETPETNRNSGRYSWFEAQLSAIQSDLNSFVEEPEDVEEYKKWRSTFELESRKDEIEGLIGENGSLEGVYRRVVPNGVDHETFWCRYFYRVDKLSQQERVRANLVKRAISVDDDDDELSWDVDDDEYEDGNGSETTGNVGTKEGDGSNEKGVSGESSNPNSNSGLVDQKEGGNINVNDNDKINVAESSKKNSVDDSLDEKEIKSEEAPTVKSDEKVKSEKEIKSEEASAVKSDEKVKSEKEMKSEEASAVKKDEKVKSEENVVNKSIENVSVEEKGEKIDVSDDIGWDEIEDTGSGDEQKISSTNRDMSPNRAELRKRLSTAEDDEDLSWDIEDDDDEPLKT